MRKLLLTTAFVLVAASAAGNAQSRSAACDPRNATPNDHASFLHQDRAGGSDCTPQSARRNEQEALRDRQQRYQERRYDRDRDEGYSGSSMPPAQRPYRPY